MHADGLAWLWAPAGLKDGPLPTHYEPLESPVVNALYAAAGESGGRSARPAGQSMGGVCRSDSSRTC